MAGGFQVWYGPGSFPVNSAHVSDRTEIVRSSSGRPLRWRKTMDVDVSYIAQTNNPVFELSNWENAVRNALAIPYQDLVLKDESGLQTSAKLSQYQSLSGVVITDGPHFPQTETPEWVRVRTARFSGFAEYLFRGTETSLISFAQTVSITGNGGPRRIWRIPVNDYDPIRQQTSKKSIVRMVQAGQAIGHLTQPPKAAYLWDADLLVNDAENTVLDGGKPIGKAWVELTTRWQYTFEADRVYPVVLQFPQL
jgi:hypothetical protein